MKNNITKNVTKTVKKIGFKIKKHSPEILIVAGVTGTVVSTVMACKATIKAKADLDDAKTLIETIDDCVEAGELKSTGEAYTEEDAKNDLRAVYVQTGVKLVKHYAPVVAIGALSIGAMVTSNNILRKRNVALATAYAAVDRGFKDYRDRVIERFGERVDYELKHNIKATKIDDVVTDENGKTKKVKKTVDVATNPNDYSDYSKFFDDGCKGWSKDPEYNLMFLKAQQQYANDLLVANGYLFLNDVYDMLGIPRTKAGQVVGWIYSDDEDHKGDNFVDFGIYDLYREASRDFVNGYERTILLDFNVDGNIWDLMK